ncbi:UDP-N-acetylmuramate dehydrogenase [Vacuolonema iberomarrocanum]|uniref:UDP-N-acetylmuramate dehydrogenase n=1 Tax=Vacuolonema iberomarrocanum TaxID=3454632 RepID=UPI0019DC8675|nr:UDP-N-acetylmuramate dehydrogenase [filamentous cyanobacterium LEGE 07170]
MQPFNMPETVQENVSLADYTSWKVGGAARWLAEPTTAEVPELLSKAYHHGIPVYFLGRGSNVLIDDAGLNGLVIVTRNSMNELQRDGYRIVAESGVFLPHLSHFAARQGYSGFEFLVGIPGTVGGAIAMNAGLTVFRPRELVSVVESFDVVNLDGTVETLKMGDIHVGYRRTDLLDGKRLILRARFQLEDVGNPEEIRQSTLDHLAERKRKQPLDQPTAGSTFKSPPGSKGAGWYIEQAGLKGFQVGGARVSPMHANWLENVGGATASDIHRLIEYIQKTVESRMGVTLEPEVQYLP